jgi:hypothetical protein
LRDFSGELMIVPQQGRGPHSKYSKVNYCYAHV